MRHKSRLKSLALAFTLILGAGLALPGTASAHCDRLDGPVATAALDALETGEFEQVAIWVAPGQEAELREVFDRSREVRPLSDEARHLADRHFIETAVRLHREAEGMPFTGLKPSGQPLPPDLEAAEQALETGDVAPLVDLMTRRMEEEIARWLEKARTARENRSAGVAAGREWIDAYVRYITYVHGLYGKIQAPPAHGLSDGSEADDSGSESR